MDSNGPKELEWGPDTHKRNGNFDGEKGAGQNMFGHVQRSIHSKQLSIGHNQYGADADWGVLDGGAYWRNLANTCEPSACGGDAALCQVT